MWHRTVKESGAVQGDVLYLCTSIIFLWKMKIFFVICKFLCFECHLLQMDTKPMAELPVDVSEITLWEVPS